MVSNDSWYLIRDAFKSYELVLKSIAGGTQINDFSTTTRYDILEYSKLLNRQIVEFEKEVDKNVLLIPKREDNCQSFVSIECDFLRKVPESGTKRKKLHFLNFIAT